LPAWDALTPFPRRLFGTDSRFAAASPESLLSATRSTASARNSGVYNPFGILVISILRFHSFYETLDSTFFSLPQTHQGKMCCGRAPQQTLIAGKEAWNEKVINLNSI